MIDSWLDLSSSLLLGFILSSGGYVIHTIGFGEVLLVAVYLGGPTYVRVDVH